MNKWNKRKYSLSKFFQLSNGQWLKILFEYKNNFWTMDIVVAKTKRQCNDCINKTEFSPKILYGKITGNKLGLEALLIAKRELLNFEKTLHYKTNIFIFAVDDRLLNVYYRGLKNNGYKMAELLQGKYRGKKYLCKVIYGNK